MEVEIKTSTQPKKKLMAIFYENGKKIKTTHFGSKPNKDFTIYSKENKKIAEEKKRNYIARHKVNEDWSDPKKAGTLSRYILWNKPTVQSSIRDYVKRFNLKLK